MKNIKKAFGGLNTQYYFRQLFFAAGMALIFLLGGWGIRRMRSFLMDLEQCLRRLLMNVWKSMDLVVT